MAAAVTGEGSAIQGAFHESLNLAALWKLPVIFVVEDNDWGISVPRSQPTTGVSNTVRAAAYDMPGIRVESNSVEAVYAAVGEAVALARSGGGGGPTLIEVHTLRLWVTSKATPGAAGRTSKPCPIAIPSPATAISSCSPAGSAPSSIGRCRTARP